MEANRHATEAYSYKKIGNETQKISRRAQGNQENPNVNFQIIDLTNGQSHAGQSGKLSIKPFYPDTAPSNPPTDKLAAGKADDTHNKPAPNKTQPSKQNEHRPGTGWRWKNRRPSRGNPDTAHYAPSNPPTNHLPWKRGKQATDKRQPAKQNTGKPGSEWMRRNWRPMHLVKSTTTHQPTKMAKRKPDPTPNKSPTKKVVTNTADHTKIPPTDETATNKTDQPKDNPSTERADPTVSTGCRLAVDKM